MLGVHLVHSRPYKPQGRGKQERLNSYIRQSFIAEMEHRGVADLDELNDYFTAWAEQVANNRVHAETHQAPIERFLADFTPAIPPPGLLAEAFPWSVVRKVTKTATINLFANRYGLDPALVGRTVECRFDPEDLAVIDIYDNGIAAGTATPFVIGRHVHPAVPQAVPPPVVDAAGGIDYMALVATAHAESLGEASISYREVRLPGLEDPADPAQGDEVHTAGSADSTEAVS